MNTVTVEDNLLIVPKIVCVGKNFTAHIQELGDGVPDDMVIFIKPNSAITTELHSFHNQQLDYELELCFMIRDNDYWAVGLGLDLTKRALQSKLKDHGLPWERCKAFNGSALFSKFIVLQESLKDTNFHFELDINGQVCQCGNIDLMIYKPETILKDILSFMHLNDGDIIMTGTPKGVGAINYNDKFTARLYNGNNTILTHKWTAI